MDTVLDTTPEVSEKTPWSEEGQLETVRVQTASDVGDEKDTAEVVDAE